MKQRRIFLKIILILIVAISASLWYVNKFVLPTKAKAFVVDFLKTQTGRDVKVGALSYNLLKGLSATDITIYDDAAFGEGEFLSVKEISLNVLILPLFKEKKIIIPSARINSPRVTVSLNKERRWNFESLAFLKEKPKPAEKKPGLQVIITNLTIERADIQFLDASRKTPVKKELSDLNLSASL